MPKVKSIRYGLRYQIVFYTMKDKVWVLHIPLWWKSHDTKPDGKLSLEAKKDKSLTFKFVILTYNFKFFSFLEKRPMNTQVI